MGRLPIPEGEHGAVSVAATSPALASRGEYVATARYRLAGSDTTQLLRRFAATEDEARQSLQAALDERIGAGNTRVLVPMPEEEAMRVLSGSVEAFRTFSQWLDANPHRTVVPGSDMAGDIALTETEVFPKGVVEALLGSVSDHLDAWITKVVDADGGRLRLHLFADFTALRPVVESLASIVWILGDDRRDLRIKRALLVGNAELRHANQYLDALNGARVSDDALEHSIVGYEQLMVEATGNAGLEVSKTMPSRPTDPTTIVRGAGPYVGGPLLDTYMHWARCSASIHGQIVGVLTHSERTIGSYSDGTLYSHAVVDTSHLAETLRFIGARLLPATVRLLNQRGLRAGPG